MLIMTVNPDKNKVVFSTRGEFDYNYKDSWITEDLTKQMIRDIDKSEVLTSSIIDGPIGAIAPRYLSGGVKGLIMLAHGYKQDYAYKSTIFGDNCCKWLLEIAKNRDILIYTRHILDFSGCNDIKMYFKELDRTASGIREYRRGIGDMMNILDTLDSLED